MLKFEWNALRVDNAVLVHDPLDPDLIPTAGTVVALEPKRSKRGVNGVGIRVAVADGHRIVWPSYLTVHGNPRDPTERCWRCDERVETAAMLLC